MKWNPHRDILHSPSICKVKLLSFCPAPNDAAYILHREAPAFRVWTVMTVSSNRGTANCRTQTLGSRCLPRNSPGSLAACDRSPHFMKLSKGLVRPSFFVCSALGRYDRQRLHTDRQNPIPRRCPAPAYLLSLYFFYIVIRAVPIPAHTIHHNLRRSFPACPIGLSTLYPLRI